MLLRWSTGNKCFQNLGISSIDDSELQRNQTEIVRPSLGCGVHRVDLLDEPSVGVPHYNMNLGFQSWGGSQASATICITVRPSRSISCPWRWPYISSRWFQFAGFNRWHIPARTDKKNGARTPASSCAQTRDRTRETQPRSKGKHATQHLNTWKLAANGLTPQSKYRSLQIWHPTRQRTIELHQTAFLKFTTAGWRRDEEPAARTPF